MAPRGDVIKPGELVFNLVAVILLVATLFWLAMLAGMIRYDRGAAVELIGEWRFWASLAGPLSFWTSVVMMYVRLRRSGDRPRFRIRRIGRTYLLTGCVDAYRAYRSRFGRDAVFWLLPAGLVLSVLGLILPGLPG